MRAEFGSCRPRQGIHGSLGHAVDGDARKRLGAAARGNVDDAATAPVLHHPRRREAAPVGAHHVDRNGPLGLGPVGFKQRVKIGHARAIEPAVERPGLGKRMVRQRIHVLAAGNVCPAGQHPAARLFDRSGGMGEPGLVDVAGDDRRSGGREDPGGFLPQPRARAREHRHLAFERERRPHLFTDRHPSALPRQHVRRFHSC